MSIVSPRKHLITLRDLSTKETLEIVNRGIDYSNQKLNDIKPLTDKVVGIYFTKTSTRTRTAFSTAALRLGAEILAYGPNDLQVNTGESMNDTLEVLSRMLDGLVVRTAGAPDVLKAFANQQRMAIVNAMTADEHPTQALADLTTMKQHFGELSGLNILYVGEGNNTAIALALAFMKFSNIRICFFTPPNYGLDTDLIEFAKNEAIRKNTVIEEFHDMNLLPSHADIVYTTRWQTTGTIKPDPNWREKFEPFAVNQELMSNYPNSIFMHDLPAHRGDEVEASVIDGSKSIVFQQAENKGHSAKAVLEWCLGE